MTTDTEKKEDEDTTPEWLVNLWEKVSDGVTTFLDGAAKLITNMVGSSNERYIRQLGYVRPNKAGAQHTVVPGSLLAQINSHEEKMRGPDRRASCEALTPEFRERLASGETLEDLLAGGVRRLPRGRLPHQEHAAFRRANARRRRAAPRQHRRNGHRRRQDARRHAAGLPQRPRTEGRSRRHGQRLPGPPRLRMDDADLQGARRHGRLHPERHGPRRPPQGLRLRHHLRHQQRVRLRLPARQHEAGPLGRRRVRPALPPVPEGAQLRHHRRGGQHPHRRGAHAAHHHRPGLQRPPPLRQGQRHRRPAHRPAKEDTRTSISRSRRRNTPAT